MSGLLDTTNSFIIKKMLLGMQRLHKRVDSRRPITIDLLVHIFDDLQYTCSSVYETTLFSSCFSLAFFAFLRVGEFAESHLLQYSDISIDKEIGLINLSLPSSKTDQLAIITNLVLPRFENVKICPAHTLLNYLKLRLKLEGPLFCHFNHKSVTRFQVSSMLKSTLMNRISIHTHFV